MTPGLPRRTALLSVVAAALLSIPAGVAQAQWRLTDLGVLATSNESDAAAINNVGQVVGSARLGQDTRALLWQGGHFVDLGSLRTQPGGYNVARDINDAGVVVGLTDTATGGYRGFVWQGGQMQGLEPLPTVPYAGATSVNRSGTVAGYSNFASSGVPTVWTNGTASGLGLPAGFESGIAADINDAGQIVLSSDFGSAFVGRSGSFVNLGYLSQSTPITQASAINGTGQVTGWSFLDNARHAFLWEAGSMHDLGAPPGFTDSEARGLNDLGQVVGLAQRYDMQAGSWTTHAFLWDGERMVDLNGLPDVARSGWTLVWANAINDSSAIVGQGIDPSSGQRHAFLLSPVPEPAGAALMLLGLVVLGRASRRAAQRCSRRYAL